MSTNRLFSLFVAAALLLVAVLVVRDASATSTVVSELDSATLSYSSWARAAEAESMDSATRSYTAWVREIVCGENPTYAMNLDSATRSYIAWAKWIEAGEACR